MSSTDYSTAATSPSPFDTDDNADAEGSRARFLLGAILDYILTFAF
jgi:hypothetical protein